MTEDMVKATSDTLMVMFTKESSKEGRQMVRVLICGKVENITRGDG